MMQNQTNNPPQLSPLFQVVTIQEAARLFFVHENTIRYHLDHNHLIYRKVGGELRGLFLIELHSLIRLFGFTPKFSS